MNTSLHIPFQNKAVQDFELLGLAPWRNGFITGQQAIAAIEKIAFDFEQLARGQFNYERALAGARDVRNLAETLKRSIVTGAEFPPIEFPVPGGGGPDGGGGGTIPIGGSKLPPRSPGSALSDKGWLVVGAVVFFLLMGGKSK